MRHMPLACTTVHLIQPSVRPSLISRRTFPLSVFSSIWQRGFSFLCFFFWSPRPPVFFPTGAGKVRLLNSIIPLFVAMTLASPLVWEHHGIFLTLPFLLLLRKMETPAEWILYGAVHLLVFLTPTFDYFPWSYGRLPGILILLMLLWIARNRSDNTFFPAFNAWAESLFSSKVWE